MTAARRVLYVDASQGASGDMILGALVDLGVPLDAIRGPLETLPLPGWKLESGKIMRQALAVTRVDVVVPEEQPARNWNALQEILTTGGLSSGVRERALRIFRRLIEAEAEVHGRSPETVHLHEAGATDAIVDIVGACAGLEHLGVSEIVVSPMTTGFGEVRCQHGVYPVPAPATAVLVRGVPVRAGNIEAERLTPTGAAILTTVADSWGAMPDMRPLAVGYGAGSHTFEDSTNALRAILGEADPVTATLNMAQEEVAVLVCTLDDATPQAVAFATRRLFDAGALEVFTTSVTMKKGRVGHQLTVLGRPDDLERLTEVLLTETSTLGLRFRMERRIVLDRAFRRVETSYGPVDVKVGSLRGRVLQVWPEYDACAALAERHGVTLWQVQQAALVAYEKSNIDSALEGESP